MLLAIGEGAMLHGWNAKQDVGQIGYNAMNLGLYIGLIQAAICPYCMHLSESNVRHQA